jgi:hypothetical protein
MAPRTRCIQCCSPASKLILVDRLVALSFSAFKRGGPIVQGKGFKGGPGQLELRQFEGLAARQVKVEVQLD